MIPEGLEVWCERGDSNPHGFPRQILSLTRSFSNRSNDCTYTHLASAVREVLCSLFRCSEEGLGRVWAESESYSGRIREILMDARFLNWFYAALPPPWLTQPGVSWFFISVHFAARILLDASLCTIDYWSPATGTIPISLLLWDKAFVQRAGRAL